MANESKFKAGQLYGAEDINNTIAFMTTEGIFDISTPNEICKSLVETGISNQDKRMEVTIVDGKVHVANGSCVMVDGSTYTIYEDGEMLDYTPGVLNYVYVVIDNTIFQNVLKCTTSEPPEDAILLAEINADNNITDKRIYSRYKFPVYKSNVNDSKKITTTLVGGENIIDIGGPDYKYIVILSHAHPSSPNYINAAALFENGLCIYNIALDGSDFALYYKGSSWSIFNAPCLSYNDNSRDYSVVCGVKITDNKLIITTRYSGSYLGNPPNIAVDIYVS